MKVISAQIEGLRSRKDRTWSVTLGTQELTPEDSAEIMKLNGKLCFVGFKIDPFTNEEQKLIESLESEPDLQAKSLSERLRNVLYVWHKQSPQGFKEFKDFYEHYMTKYIDNIKIKLEP
jgi:hypothetical protein